MYYAPYEAEFECPKGHRFKEQVPTSRGKHEVMCPTCYAEWIEANVPNGVQVGEAVAVDPRTLWTHD